MIFYQKIIDYTKLCTCINLRWIFLIILSLSIDLKISKSLSGIFLINMYIDMIFVKLLFENMIKFKMFLCKWFLSKTLILEGYLSIINDELIVDHFVSLKLSIAQDNLIDRQQSWKVNGCQFYQNGQTTLWGFFMWYMHNKINLQMQSFFSFYLLWIV